MKLFSRPIAALLMVAVVFSAISSCKKDKEKPKSELIIGSWIQTGDVYNPAYDIDQDGTKDTDIFQSFYDACEKDNIIIFTSGGTGEFNEGGSKCSSTDPQSEAFNWSLMNNDTVLSISGQSFPISELSGNTLKILVDTFEENGVTYTNTLTFKRK